MVRIRFRRVGLKKQPSYRIVVTDKRSPRDGRFIENIGHHNPRTRPQTDVIDEGRALYWLSVGAQPSDSVRRLMQRTGTWGRFERLRGGETMETLVEEAQAVSEAADPISPRTSYPAPGPGQSRQKAQTAVAAVEVETTAAIAEVEVKTIEDSTEVEVDDSPANDAPAEDAVPDEETGENGVEDESED